MEYDYLYVENTYKFIDIFDQEETVKFDNENDLYLYVYNIHLYNYDLIVNYTDYINEILETNYINAISGCNICKINYIQLIEILYMFFTDFVERYIYVSENNNIYFTEILDKIYNKTENIDKIIINEDVEIINDTNIDNYDIKDEENSIIIVNDQKNNNIIYKNYYDRDFPSMYITYEFSYDKSFNSQMKQLNNYMHSGGIVP